MESLVLLVLAFSVVIPLLSFIAFFRTGRLRRALNEQQVEHQRAISDLRREIATLRNSFAQLSQKLEERPSPAVAPEFETPGRELRETPAQEPMPFDIAEEAPSISGTTPTYPAPITAPAEPPKVEPPWKHVPELAPIEAFDLMAISRAKPVSTPPSVAATPAIPTGDTTEAKAPAAWHWPERSPLDLSSSTVPPPRPVQHEQPRPAAPGASAPYRPYSAPPRKSLAEWLRSTLPLEEVLGMNLFAKFGIILLVIGFALLGRVALLAMGPGAKAALLYLCSIVLLGGGIWLEGKERYRLIGRTGIGGGWALLFFTTYALHHVEAMQVMDSNTLNCLLLLGVAVAMVAHTLRYQSQLVTGLAFLLAFSTVALSQDTVYALTAGVILAIGIVAIALSIGWYELEVFGILASYLNHLYWLYKLYPEGVAGHAFPQFWPSTIILLLYWLTFRISYVARRIRDIRDEHLSTIAALLNTALLLAVMKFQSTHPELTFYALLMLGGLEFAFGQLPITRRRRMAFTFLTILGTALIFTAVPFKFTGNNIALLWMLGAEVLLIAGISQAEVVFRRLGLLTGLLTGLLIALEAKHVVDLRISSEMPLYKDGILLLTCAACFYFNAHFLRQRWKELFEGIDSQLASSHSYIGAITGFLGAWGVFTGDWTAIAWIALMLLAVFGSRRRMNKDLLWQGWAFAGAVMFRALIANLHGNQFYPVHVQSRLLTVPILAIGFYLSAWVLEGGYQGWAQLQTTAVWAGSFLLVALAWFEIAPAWIAVTWMAFAVVLALIGRRLNLNALCSQEHLLAALVAAQLLGVNLDLSNPYERYLPFAACAAMLYAISRFCTLPEFPQKRFVGYGHTWAATILLAALVWQEAPDPWIAPLWALFALALALVDRFFEVEELPAQAHTLAAFAAVPTASINMFTAETWRHIDVRLITVSIVVVVWYAMALCVRIPKPFRDREFHHAYSWVAGFFATWLLWSELKPIAVAVGVALFGLVLFECGLFQKEQQLRRQGYCALTAAFVRIFLVNLTAIPQPGETITPRVYTVLPLALIYFFVWSQLQPAQVKTNSQHWNISSVFACFGTGCILAMLYFQISPEWIIAAWAGVLLALILAEVLLSRRIFLEQAMVLAVAIVARGFAHNIFGGSYFTSEGWHGNFAVLSLTAALLFGGLSLSFRLRSRYTAQHPKLLLHQIFYHPEQVLFFAPVALITGMFAVKMTPGMVTLSLALEGVMLIPLGLVLSQRSYRLTGLLLLLVCVGKIVSHDAWQLTERDRYITFIVLGAGLTLVSMLYNRYRESIRRLL